MIYKKIFNFGTKNLELKSIEPISEDIQNNLDFLIDTLVFELNHNFQNSSAWRFNNSQINIPVSLKREFIDYFEYNLDFHLNLKDSFNPFEFESKTGDISKDTYVKDHENMGIIKLKPFSFDTGYLRTPYILELIKKYLKERGIKNFTLIISNFISAVGDYKWESRFTESEQFSAKTFNLRSLNALLMQNISGEFSDKFGEKGTRSKISELILAGKDLSQLRILEPNFKDLKTSSELEKAAKDYKIDVILLDPDNEVRVFKGS